MCIDNAIIECQGNKTQIKLFVFVLLITSYALQSVCLNLEFVQNWEMCYATRA